MNNKLLIGAVGGRERFNNIVRDLKEVIEKYNLENSPGILRDVVSEVLGNKSVTKVGNSNGDILHNLKIENGAIYLDDVAVKGVYEYELKSSAMSIDAELMLKLEVSKFEVDF